jgi:CRISPR/Cas system CSM-associated protein Csm3 (group 7 of RAMP superfamily)
MNNQITAADRITGKLVIHAKIVNTSPLSIGSGATDQSDMDILTSAKGKPYIPASSFVGCLRQSIRSLTGENLLEVWGGYDLSKSYHIKDNAIAQSEIESQSNLIVDDLEIDPSETYTIICRDGVKISYETSTAESHHKYDYQILESQNTFDLRMEFTERAWLKSILNYDIIQIAALIQFACQHDFLRLGAKSTSGFGAISLEEFNAYYLDFTNTTNSKTESPSSLWFKYIDQHNQTILEQYNINSEISQLIQNKFNSGHLKKEYFTISATFKLKSSLLTHSSRHGTDNSDKSQLMSRNQYLLSGKSIRGALRHRAFLIEQNNTQLKGVTDELFGYVDKINKIANKSKMIIEESYISPDKVHLYLQNRVKIDRFTGGALHGALFNSEAIWASGKEAIVIKIKIFSQTTHKERLLLILLLKDLWLEDLAIGGEKNIGRGILTGLSASIDYRNQSIEKTISLKQKQVDSNQNNSSIEFTHGTPQDLIDITTNPQYCHEKQ